MFITLGAGLRHLGIGLCIIGGILILNNLLGVLAAFIRSVVLLILFVIVHVLLLLVQLALFIYGAVLGSQAILNSNLINGTYGGFMIGTVLSIIDLVFFYVSIKGSPFIVT